MSFRRPSPAMLVALLALFVALGGSSYAALKLPKGSVGAKQLKPNSVTSPKVKPGSLLLSDFRASQRATLSGAAGPQGAQGPQGPAGEPATRLFAHLRAFAAPTTPTLISGIGVTGIERNGSAVGQYRVLFDRDLTGCVPVANKSSVGAFFDGNSTSVSANVNANIVRLSLDDAADAAVDRDVAVAVFCP